MIESVQCIGVMSGSSLDGIDIVIVQYDEEDSLHWQLMDHRCYSLPAALASALKEVHTLSVKELALLESTYTGYLSECILDIISNKNYQIACCGVHGHTVLHLPDSKVSWQLLNGGLLAENTNLVTVCDFRNQDIAQGGVGTPMAVIADRDLFPGYDYYINLGGIANISYCHNGQWAAYDLFPCNQVFNYYAQKMGKPYDESGTMASQGNIDQKLLHLMLSDEYIRSAFPKSIDNQWVKDHWLVMMDNSRCSIYDNMRTHTECMVNHLSSLITDTEEVKVLLSGGGAYNSFFIEQLKSRIANANFIIPENNIIDYKEAILMSYMAYLRINNRPNFIASATGANYDVCGGAVYYPSGLNN